MFKLLLILLLQTTIIYAKTLTLSDINNNKNIINFDNNKPVQIKEKKIIMISYFSPSNKLVAKKLINLFKKYNLNSQKKSTKFHSYAIVNLKDNYIPKFFIRYRLKKLINKSVNFSYYYDNKGKLLIDSNLKENEYNVLLYEENKLIFNNNGIVDKKELKEIENILKQI